MKEPHSNEQTSPGVLMTPAQKAAHKINDGLVSDSEFHQGKRIYKTDVERERVFTAIIQSALLAKEGEIAKLRDALQEMTAHVLVLSPSDPGDCPICDKARQALSRDGK